MRLEVFLEIGDHILSSIDVSDNDEYVSWQVNDVCTLRYKH